MGSEERLNMNPKVSIIIVNFNGKKYLEDCFSSLKLAGKVSREIIFVDNASTDGSVAFVKKNFPKTIIIKNSENLGFAGGNNVGLKQAKGGYILLLNNDTKVEVNFLDNFLKAFQEIPNLGCAQPKIVLMKDNNIIDSCGSFLTGNLFLYHFGYDKRENILLYNKPFPIFAAKGACMLIKREVIDKIGLFDDDYWCYYEETDFCHRVWLSGWECWYYPKVKILHLGGGTSLFFNGSYIQYINFKNRLNSLVKNLEVKTLLIHFPLYILTNIILSLYWLVNGKFKLSLSLYEAIIWNLFNLNKTLKARKKVQLQRIISDNFFFNRVMKNPRLSYYYYLFHGLKNYSDQIKIPN